jgi:hypothetical protein
LKLKKFLGELLTFLLIISSANNLVSAKGYQNNYYIISYSSIQKLTYDNVAYLTKYELSIARNEIYARHGYIFKTKEYINYFKNQSWYRTNKYFSEKCLSQVEQYNIKLLLNAEKGILPAKASYNSRYIVPFSNVRKVTYNDIAYLSKYELSIARNEIYARHGYIFKTKEYINYFKNQSWYSPNKYFKESYLTKIEQYNIRYILSIENLR